MAKITIFYGEMGSGKSHNARRYAEENEGLTFYEGDDAVTPELQSCVLFRPIPKDVLEDFLFKHLTPEIHARASSVPHLIVAQALYSRAHRRQIQETLESYGHKVRYVLVKVSMWRNARQLLTRKWGTLWVAYWLMNHPFFEE